MEDIDNKISCVYRLYNEYKNGKSKKNKEKIEKLVSVYFDKKVGVCDVLGNINLRLLNIQYNKGYKKGGSSWVTKPRDTSAYTTKGLFWDIPRHASAAVINVASSVYDSGKLLVSALTLPRDFASIVNKPNEPIPSDSKAGKFFNEYMGK